MNKNFESGQLSRTLIILAFAVILIAGVVYGILRLSMDKKARLAQEEAEQALLEAEEPKPVYETTIEDVRFLFQSAIDLGSLIKAQNNYQTDLKTTEKFLYVTVRAQNKGLADIPRYSWDIGNIVDSAGRNFIPYADAYAFLPKQNLCGAILKPEFEPIPCVKMYEVSKVSENLKIEVIYTPQNSSKPQSQLIDIAVR